MSGRDSEGTLTAGNDLFSFGPCLDGNEELFLGLDAFFDLLFDIEEMALFWELDILDDVTLLIHELREVVLDGEALVLFLEDNGAWDHIASSESLFVLLVGEDVLSCDHGLGRTVLSWFGSRESGDLAWENFLEHDEGAWLHAAGFSKLGGGSTGVSLVKFVIRHTSRFQSKY